MFGWVVLSVALNFFHLASNIRWLRKNQAMAAVAKCSEVYWKQYHKQSIFMKKS